MPRYFFDCFDGRSFQTDPSGIEAAGLEDVADHGAALARALLGEVAGSLGTRAVSVMVRSEDGAQVYVAHCGFQGVEVPGRRQPGPI